MKNSLLIALVVAVGASAFAGNYGVPKIHTPGGQKAAPGIGKFEANQAVVSKVMAALGWNESTKFEETGLAMKDLLNKQARKDAKFSDYLKTLADYFSSEEFKGQSKELQKKDIFQAKLVLKMSLNDLVNGGDTYHTTSAK